MTKKAKKMTFRQRLRADAEKKLDRLAGAAIASINHVCEEDMVGIKRLDLARLISGGQNKTLRGRLITELANEREAELEKIYNDQMDLLTENNDDNDKD